MEHLATDPRTAGNDVSIDETIIDLNKAIMTLLQEYVPAACDIRFDLPEEEPGSPTISVFLYDIQEDVQMRSGERRAFSSGLNNYEPGCAHVQCNYRITYWNQKQGKGGDINAALPGSQALLVMNRVLNALLNNRELPAIPNSYSRVMAPSDGLNTLGHFWQAMDNKPKLSLSYAVTVPIKLYGKKASGSLTPVNSTLIQWAEMLDVEVVEKLERQLTVRLLSQLSPAARAQVGMQVKLNIQTALQEGRSGVEVVLSGRISEFAHQEVISVLNGWLNSATAPDGPEILDWQWRDMAPVIRDKLNS